MKKMHIVDNFFIFFYDAFDQVTSSIMIGKKQEEGIIDKEDIAL